MDYKIEEKKIYLESVMGKKRFTHSLNVANEAENLAKYYGYDSEKAYFTGLMHDCCKEFSAEEQKKLILKSDLGVDENELKTPPLWHGIAGAVYVRDVLGINDSDIINAIRFHTVARANMSLLEEIIYISDVISAERHYDGVDIYRKSAYENLQVTVLEFVKYTFAKIMKKNGFIPKYSFEAYNYYLGITQKPEEK